MEKLTSIIRDALQLPNAEVEIMGISGGMTNLNYLVVIDSVQYIVRIPGNGTTDFIDRTVEKENLELGSALGINPSLRYFNINTGLKITERIKNAITLTTDVSRDEEIMKKVADIFNTLHYSNEVMSTHFKLFEMMEMFEDLALEAGAAFYDGFEEVKAEVKSVENYYKGLDIELKPCHIDPACSNFILNEKGKMYLIDWEYSGMFDPMWDIAAHSLEVGFSELEEALFVNYYVQREATEQEQERLFLHKIFQDYLWSLWTLFKEEKGDDFGIYGKMRFERLKSNLRIYNGVLAG